MHFNTKDNSSIQRLMFTHLWATIWKLRVMSVKLLEVHTFAKPEHGGLHTHSHAVLQSHIWRPSTHHDGIAGSNVHCNHNHSFMMQKPQLLQVIAINSLGYVVLDLSLWGSVQDTASFLSYSSDAFSRQTGTSLCWWIRSPATSQLPGGEPQWVLGLPAFLLAHKWL